MPLTDTAMLYLPKRHRVVKLYPPPQKKFISFLNSSLSVPVWEEKGTPMQSIAPYLVLLFFPLRYFLTQNILFLTLAKRRILSNNSKRGVYKKTGRCACCRLRQREEQQEDAPSSKDRRCRRNLCNILSIKPDNRRLES